MFQSIFRPDTFKGAVVLVTGGGTGIGRAIAHELSSCAATVVICARRANLLMSTANEIHNATGNQVDWHEMNIRDSDSVKAVVATVLQKHGKITHLVNNAGGQFVSPAEDISLRGFRSVVDLNVMGTWHVIRAVFDQYMKDNGGRVVNVLVGMQNGFPFMAHSGAARSAIENLSMTLATEWGPLGVAVNCVSPGTIVGNGLTRYPPHVLDMTLENAPKLTTIGRLGTEAEISAAVVFLLSPASHFIVGANLKVDGGVTLAKSYIDIPAPDHTKINAAVSPYMGYTRADSIYPNSDSGKKVDPKLIQLAEKYALSDRSRNKSRL